MDIITGYTGKAHVTAEQDRDINQGIIGSGSYVLQTGSELKAEVSSNNEIKIRDGVLIHQGCAASIKKNTYDSLTIINGSQGMNRIDLIVARYSRNKDSGVESLKLMVIQGTPTSGTATVPTYTKGDIQAGDYIADMPMYQVIISGLNITEVKKVFETAPNLTELNSKLITGDFVQLATAGAIKTQTAYKDIDSLSNYKAIALYCNYSSGYYCNPVICSVELFKAMTWIVSDRRDNNQNYSAMLHYESDTRVRFVTTNSDAALYGIR